MSAKKICKEIADYGVQMLNDGLTEGTGGNISARLSDGKGIAITPSGVDYHEIDPSSLCKLTLEGEPLLETEHNPSSEAPMHTLIYRHREDVNAIIHTHSPYASTIATAGMKIPPIYYLSGLIGEEIPVADYETYGTEKIAQSTLNALGEKNAVLLERHGVLAVSTTLKSAYKIALVVEKTARIFYQTLSAGITPEPLTSEEIQDMRDRANIDN